VSRRGEKGGEVAAKKSVSAASVAKLLVSSTMLLAKMMLQGMPNRISKK
jgi:hypothetical protein